MPNENRDHLSRTEIQKDAVQGAVVAAASTVGHVASIVTTAVRDVAGALGDFATEVFEIRDSARRASADHGDRSRAGSDDGSDGGDLRGD